MRIMSVWPLLRVRIHDELVQDLDLQRHPELRYRLRSGYIGIESLSYPLRFRNLRIQELPAKAMNYVITMRLPISKRTGA
jgi:hypothetical protein